MPLDKDYYRILQVQPSAEHETIHAAYKRLSRKYHPDMNKSPDATRQMQDINEAYAVLSDPQKRAEYDRRKRHSSLGTEAERHVRERQQKLAMLYERGIQLLSQNRWAGALAVFDELLALDPAYRDAPARRQAARRALEERQRADKLAQLYREAMEHFRAERWQVAIDEFKEIQRLDPGDRNIPHLLRKAEQQNRLAILYEQGLQLLGQSKWANPPTVGGQCPGRFR
jgi:curved DNA-binding protein CbpA